MRVGRLVDRGDASGPPLFGRERELAAVSTFVASLRAGRGGLLVVEGEAGIGKSSLLDALAALAAVAGVRLAWRSAELDRSRPFGPLIGAFDLRATSLDPDAAEIGRVLGQSPSGAGAPSVEGWQVADAILDHVEELASRGPVLVVIDDVQWADAATLRVLSAFADRSAELPLGVAIVCRPAPRSAEVDRLLASLESRVDTTSVALTVLAHGDVAGLLAALAGAPPGPRLSRLAVGAGGNPVVRRAAGRASLRAASQLEVGTLAEATSDYMPVSLRVAIDRRVRAVAPPTQRLLRLASVLGTTFSLEQLAAVSEHDVLAVAEQLRPAFDDSLLGDDGSAGIAFRHDLVREAVYASLPVAERIELHHLIGRRLATAGAPAAHVAEHLAVGAVRGDSEVVKWLRKAGLVAAAHDAAAAVGYLERAVALSLPSDPRRSGLVAAFVNQLILVGRYSDAERHSRGTVADTQDPTIETLLRLALGSLLFGAQRLDEARHEFLLAADVAPRRARCA